MQALDTPCSRSGAVVVLLQSETTLGYVDESRKEPSVLFRNGSTTVFLTGVIQPENLQFSDGTLPIPLAGLGNISLTSITPTKGEGILPFAFTASGIIWDATWPEQLSIEALETLSVPVVLQAAEGLPMAFEEAEGRMMFSSLSKEYHDKVAFTIVGKGNVSSMDDKGWTESVPSNICGERNQETEAKGNQAVVFLQSMDSGRTEGSRMPVRPWGVGGSVGWDDDDDNTGGTGMQPWGVGGSVTWRSGSNTVLLSGGVPASALAVTDGTWPLPLADGTLPLPFAVNFTTLRIEDNAPTSTSEGTLPFALESRGGLVVPKEWLQDGTLPFPLAQELSKLSIKVAIQSGLTLPRGLQGTGKLVFPDSFDGSNPWPHIPKDMLPYVLTGEGTINLTDGTWPLPRLESGDRIIPIKRVMENFSVTSEPVHPDDRATVVAPEGTKASPDPVNPDDLPPTDVISNGPSGVGPDPVNPDDRIKKGCGCGH